MQRVIGVVLGLVLLALGAFLVWPTEEAALVAPQPGEVAPASAAQLSATAMAASHPEADVAAASATREVAVAPAVSPANLARLSGRCVDAVSGEPLAGCVLNLQGWESNDERVERHGKRVDWTDPAPFTTGADGRFDLRFDPPPPYQFALTIEAPVHATMSARWSEIAAGEQKDFGDVRMPRGARVTGRVVDSKGVPMARVGVRLESGANDEPRLSPRPYTSGRSAADGLFTIHGRVAAGEWRVEVGSEARLKGPQTLTIGADQGEVSLQVEVFAADELDVIEGVVLDEHDRPAPGVDLDPSIRRGGGQHWTCSSDRQGRFRLIREQNDSREPVAFSVRFSRGYEPMSDPRRFDWGTKDVVLRVRRALTLEVQAVDAETGAPIRAFGVRCIPDTSQGWSSQDTELRAKGEHRDGVAVVADVRRGKLRLLVEPTERETHAPSVPVELQMTDAGLPRQIVRVPRWSSRVVEVVRADGQPVADSQVQVLVALDARPISVATMAYPSDRLFQGNAPQAWLAAEARTGADGRALLRMVTGAEHVVRAMGPGHVPALQADVVAASEPLRLTVMLGATVVGRFTPSSVVDGLRPAEGGRQDRRHYQPTVVLRDGPARKHPGESEPAIAVPADGSFVISGVPPGDWRLHLDSWVFSSVGGGSGGGVSYTVCDVRGLRDGERREVVADLTRFVKGELRGQVLCDGVPAAGARLFPRGTVADGRGGETAAPWVPAVAVGDDGRFAVALLPGRWRCNLALRGQRGMGVALPEEFEVRSGATTEVVVQHTSAVLVVRLVDAQDQPVANRDVAISAGDGFQVQLSTDGDGRLVVDPAPRTPLEFFVWPPDLASQEQRMQAAKQSDWSAVGARRQLLGTHVIPAGTARDEITLRLPK